MERPMALQRFAPSTVDAARPSLGQVIDLGVSSSGIVFWPYRKSCFDELGSLGWCSPAMSPVRQRLRSATGPIHESLHHHPAVVALLGSTAPMYLYRELLGRLYGVYVPLEHEIERARRHLGDELRRSMRPRAGLLMHDLEALGLSPSALGRFDKKPDVAPMTTTEEALGALYVVQGSAFGGRAIARRLRRVGPARMPMRFFEGFPEDHDSWRLCCEALERCATGGDVNRLIEAAVSTFRHVAEWLGPLRIDYPTMETSP
jgi:heme oxygenase